MEDKILDRLKKIRKLAEYGSTDGEREAAQALLDKIINKYDIELCEISDDEEIEDFDFDFHGHDEKVILMQVGYKVTGIGTYYELRNRNTNRKIKTQIRKKCTKSQSIEIQILFEFYRDLWYEEKDYFMKAFVQKHRLFGDSDEDVDPVKLSNEEILKIQMMEAGLSHKSPLKLLESSTN